MIECELGFMIMIMMYNLWCMDLYVLDYSLGLWYVKRDKFIILGYVCL